LRKWLDATLTELPRKSGTAEVIRYALARWRSDENKRNRRH
jgi:hypothetical protein